MEKLVTIVSQSPVKEERFEDKNGQPQVMAYREYEILDGVDHFIGVIKGELARRIADVDLNYQHTVQGAWSFRSGQRQDGTTWSTNEFRITLIS